MSAEFKPSGLGALGARLGQVDPARSMEMLRQYAPQLVTAVAVIGLAWQAADLTWMLWGLRGNPAADAVSQSAMQTAAPIPAVNPQLIANAHLFGAPGAAGQSTDPNSLPQAQVNLVLTGTMAFKDPQSGYAFLGDNVGNAKFHQVGDTINGIARLHSVYADRVVIDRNGALENLMLPKKWTGGTFTPPPVAANPAAENLRRLVNAGPEAISNLLRSQPVFANGTLQGFRVYPGQDRRQFVRSGLLPGDLVKAINGTTLDDPNRSNEILNSLTSSATAVLTVERNGVVQQLNLDMTQLSIPDPATDAGATPRANPGPQTGNRGGTPPTAVE